MADTDTLRMDLADVETFVREAIQALAHGASAVAVHKLDHAMDAIGDVRSRLVAAAGLAGCELDSGHSLIEGD